MSNPIINPLSEWQEIVVTSTQNSGDGTLRQALSNAASLGGQVHIKFADELFVDENGNPSKICYIKLTGNDLIPTTLNLSDEVVIGNSEAGRKVYIYLSGYTILYSSSNFNLTFQNIIFSGCYRNGAGVIHYTGSSQKYLKMINCAIVNSYSSTNRSFITGANTYIGTCEGYFENCIFHLARYQSTTQTTYYVYRGNGAMYNCSIFVPVNKATSIPVDLSTCSVVGCIANYMSSAASLTWEAAENKVADDTNNVFIPEYPASGTLEIFSGALSAAQARIQSVRSYAFNGGLLLTSDYDFWGRELGTWRSYGAIDGAHKHPDTSGVITWDNESAVEDLGYVAGYFTDENYVNYLGVGYAIRDWIPEVYSNVMSNNTGRAYFQSNAVLFEHPDYPDATYYVTAVGGISKPSMSVNPVITNRWSLYGSNLCQRISWLYQNQGNKLVFKLDNDFIFGSFGNSTKTENYYIHDEISANVYYGPKENQVINVVIKRPDLYSKNGVEELDLSDNTTYCAVISETEYTVNTTDLKNVDFVVREDVKKVSYISLKTDSPPYNKNRFKGETEDINMKKISYKGRDDSTLDVNVLISDGVVIYSGSGGSFIERIFGDYAQTALYALDAPMTIEQSITVFG